MRKLIAKGNEVKMSNTHISYIANKPFTLTQLAKNYNVSYSTVRKWYKRGYRNEQLLQKSLQSKQPTVKIGKKEFENRLGAAKKLGISKSTFYRKAKQSITNLSLSEDGFATDKFIVMK